MTKINLAHTILFVTAFLSNCSSKSLAENKFQQGTETTFEYNLTEVSAGTIEQLNIEYGTSVSIQSSGGIPADFYALADKLMEANAKLHFTGVCLSACAEVLVPLDLEKYAYQNTLIGYHWNAHVNLESVRTIADNDCVQKYKQEIQDKENFLEANRIRLGYWEVSSFVLDLVDVAPVPERECEFQAHYRYQMWFPTSEQIRELMGISFEAGICNDSVACVEMVYKRRIGQGIVIGSEKYAARKDKLKHLGSYAPELHELIQKVVEN